MKRLSTSDVILTIFKCLFVFYGAYYGCSSVIYAIYSMENFDGTIPFNFKTWVDFGDCCLFKKEEMVNTVSMVAAFPVAGAMFGLLVLNWVWDYAVTTAAIHVAISCLVMLDFPYSWSWWVCLAMCLVLMVLLGELVSWLRRHRNRSRMVVPILDKEEEINYLYK